MRSLLCSFLDDWGRDIGDGLGRTGLIIFIVAFVVIMLFMLYNIFLAQIFKPRADRKFKIKWVQFIFVMILALFTVRFCMIRSSL